MLSIIRQYFFTVLKVLCLLLNVSDSTVQIFGTQLLHLSLSADFLLGQKWQTLFKAQQYENFDIQKHKILVYTKFIRVGKNIKTYFLSNT